MRIDKIKELIVRVRDHYVDQFILFVDQKKEIDERGAAEMKFELPDDDTNAFRHLAVVDYVRTGDEIEGMLFEPENILSFDRIDLKIGETDVIIDGLRWDGAAILHDVKDIASALGGWFESWFDPDEIGRFDPHGRVTQCIHAVYIEEDELQVDFGTAEPAAFWELLDCLSHAGATRLHVSA